MYKSICCLFQYRNTTAIRNILFSIVFFYSKRPPLKERSEGLRSNYPDVVSIIPTQVKAQSIAEYHNKVSRYTPSTVTII